MRVAPMRRPQHRLERVAEEEVQRRQHLRPAIVLRRQRRLRPLNGPLIVSWERWTWCFFLREGHEKLNCTWFIRAISAPEPLNGGLKKLWSFAGGSDPRFSFSLFDPQTWSPIRCMWNPFSLSTQWRQSKVHTRRQPNLLWSYTTDKGT